MATLNDTAQTAAELLLWLGTGKAAEQGARRRHEGDNTLIALALYDAGDGSVEALVKDWELSPEQGEVLLAAVRLGWSRGRWTDRRDGPKDRRL